MGTRLVVKHLGKITLGVGDGANDCDMITAAHLGVGIHGVEGSAAVNSADFALSQFKHLQNLLFVHGRWTYRRISRAVTYFFYKNMIPTLTILFYIMVTGFSGISMYNAMVISGYNLVFTSLPVIVFALMEQDITSDKSLEDGMAHMYTLGQANDLLKSAVFGLWIVEAIWAAITCFLFTWYGLSSVNGDGMPRAQGQVSIAMFTSVVLVVTLRLAIDTQFWTWLHAVSYVGSILLWFLFIMVECAVPGGLVTDGTMYWDFYILASDAGFYLTIPLTTLGACFPSYLYRSYNRNYTPPAIVSKWCPLFQGPNVVEKAQLKARERLEMDDDTKREASAVSRVSRFISDVEDRTQADDAIAEAGRVEI